MPDLLKKYWPLIGVVLLILVASSGDSPNESDPREQAYAAGVWSWSLATAQAAPSPSPTPSPGGVCENCNGRGKVGDGTVMVTCAVCDGTGRHPGGDDDGAAPETEELPPDDPDEPEQEPQQQAVYTYGSCSDGSCGVSRGGRVGFFRRVFGRR